MECTHVPVLAGEQPVTAYWSLFLLSLFPEQRTKLARRIFWTFAFLAIVVLVGLRLEVGCDWDQYFYIYKASQSSFSKAFSVIDPGYAFINWLAGRMGGGYHLANLISATLFTTGLVIFVKHQPLPVLALVVAIPYMTIVVAMGYTRQAIALGFLMAALTRLGHGRNIAYFLLILLGALFHKTVVVLLPLGLVSTARGLGLMNWFAFGFAMWSGSILILDSYETLWTNYVDERMQSEGALIRVSMNVAAALVFLYMRKFWDRRFKDGYLWQWIALASLASLLMLPIATTAVDRMALYFLPLQIIVFSRLPLLFPGKEARQNLTRLIVLGYAAVLFVWLNYAAHSVCWVPYHNALEPNITRFFTKPV
jgi:EpsG family